MTSPSIKATSTTAPGANAREALKVLLVDDDSFQLKLMTGILQGLGVTDITAATSGPEALQQLKLHGRFNLMLLDLHMPGMDGFQFMESVASVGYRGALIIVSGQGNDVMHSASLVAQIRRFTLLGTVSKPVGRAALAGLIAKMG